MILSPARQGTVVPTASEADYKSTDREHNRFIEIIKKQTLNFKEK